MGKRRDVVGAEVPSRVQTPTTPAGRRVWGAVTVQGKWGGEGRGLWQQSRPERALSGSIDLRKA